MHISHIYDLTCWSIFFANSNRKLLTSTSNIFETPKNLAKIICIKPVGPAPNITIVSAFCKFTLFKDRKQHAIGSINAASEKLILSGSLTSPPLREIPMWNKNKLREPTWINITCLIFFTHCEIIIIAKMT